MEVRYDMQTRKHGPSQTLCFIVAGDGGSEIISSEINVNDLAWVLFRFRIKPANDMSLLTLESVISLKKHEKAKFFTVKIHLSCDKFERQCICPDDWAEFRLNPKKQNFFLYNVAVFSLEVIVTVRDITLPSPISKLFEDTEFTDFQLCSADGTVAVHKALLSVYSDMFKTMLSGEWKETAEGRINLDGVNVQTLQHLKEYMYLGTLPDDGLETLLLLAVHYLMDSLKADCIRKLVERVRPDNLNGLIIFAFENNLPDLMKAILLETPDRIINGIYNLEMNKQEV